jgi:hypothetical protein
MNKKITFNIIILFSILLLSNYVMAACSCASNADDNWGACGVQWHDCNLATQYIAGDCGREVDHAGTCGGASMDCWCENFAPVGTGCNWGAWSGWSNSCGDVSRTRVCGPSDCNTAEGCAFAGQVDTEYANFGSCCDAGCAGLSPGYYDPPFWGGCGDAPSCDGQGNALAFCDGCRWNTDWGSHQCQAYNPNPVCSPGAKQCSGNTAQTCHSSGCYWESTACSGESSCSGGSCVAACGDGSDNDGDGFRDGQDTDCGGCGQCTSGCCNTANGCILDGDSGAGTCASCGTWFATGATAGSTPNCCGDDGGSDNFYYQSGNPTTSTSMTCNRCAAGGTSGGTLYGNGYLDDANNLCYYGDMTCNAGAAASSVSEACNDACVNDNDGGACTTTHNPTAAETCYFTDSCTDGTGCGFGASGALRQNYCDTCGATGITNAGAAYCPTPATWENTTCYSGAQTCTGLACNLAVTTTLCSANNASCCNAGTDLINEAVSCNAATGAQGSQFDRDTSQARCESTAISCSAHTWVNGGESTPFGEYAAGNSLACCGDDANEFFTTSGVGASKCCAGAGMCTDAGGMCRSGQEDTQALCTNGLDDDCDGTIDENDATCFGTVNGTVYDGDNSGYVVQGANVKSSPPGMASSFERNDASDIQGYYSLTNVFVGTYNIVARKDGYIDDIVEVTVLASQNVQQDFYLYTGVNCKADCTDGRNICNKACAGLTFNDGTCNFVNSSCHNRPKDYKYTFVDAANQYHEITCCEGPENVYPALKPEVEGNVDNLYDQAVPVKINGKTYIMHILVWN